MVGAINSVALEKRVASKCSGRLPVRRLREFMSAVTTAPTLYCDPAYYGCVHASGEGFPRVARHVRERRRWVPVRYVRD